MPSRRTRLTDRDYERLLAFRTGLRTFLKWSRDQAARAGLAPAQHQLLLAVRGHAGHPDGPTIGDVAAYLLIRAHSAAELASRAEDAGLVSRMGDRSDGRVVRLRLTAGGERTLAAITASTLEELERLGPQLRSVWAGLD